MEDLIKVLGTLFFMFLVLAAATEVVLEVFRGFAEKLGIPWVQSKVSLEEALKLSAEFAGSDNGIAAKLEALQSAAVQVKASASVRLATLNGIRADLAAATSDEVRTAIAARLAAAASTVKADLDQAERTKVWILRFAAAAVGCFLVYHSEFFVFKLLGQAKEAQQYASTLAKLQAEWVNVLIGGVAAAAGSGFWHDQLDKLRSIKSAVGAAKSLS